MKNTIALVSLLLGTHFAFAHASDGVKVLKTPNSDLSVSASADERRLRVTDDSQQFDEFVGEHRVVTHVDFSSVAGQSAPLLVESMNESTVKILGSVGSLFPQAVTSYQGSPATYWFGDQAQSTFVLANGSVQIVFPQDVDAVNLLTSTADKEKLSPDQGSVLAFGVTVLDVNGLMVGQQSITDLSISGDSAFLGILSDIPFRSIIISNTVDTIEEHLVAKATWMYSNLNYSAENNGYVKPVHTEQPDEKYDRPCTGAEGICMDTETLIPVNDPVEESSTP